MLSRRFVLYAALVSSGAAALAYENAWGRMLYRIFGVGDQAIAVVLAAYFFGLGAGSALGGRFAERVRRPALAYAALEIGIALFAALSTLMPELFLDLYAALGKGQSDAGLLGIRVFIAVVMLLPPTLMMGATLPFLISAVVADEEDEEAWDRSATWLYAANTFGAVLGTALSGLYLIPVFGTVATIWIAAGGSAFAALIVYAAYARARREVRAPEAAVEDAGEVRFPLVGPLLAATAGLLSLGGEVLWTRVLRTIVQGTTQAFAAMLVSFLLGIGLGSLLAERMGRGRKALMVFGLAQLAAATLTAAAMALTPQIPRVLVLLHGEPSVVPHEAWVVLVVSLLLLFPLALALGTSVPLLFRIEGEDDAKNAGRHAGRVLAANTFGGLTGALFVGFVAIPAPWGGMERTLITIVGLHALIATIALRASSPGSILGKVGALTGPAVIFTLILLAKPSLEMPFLLEAAANPVAATIEGAKSQRTPLVFYEEGRSTTVTVLQRGPQLQLLNDGRPESGINFGDPPFGSQLVGLGGIPALVADERERSMIIGLGGGHTAWLALEGGFQEVVVVELEEGVVRAAELLFETRAKARNEASQFPLADPRAVLVVDDARARLALSDPGSFDAVVSQPSHPWLAGSSALYTLEFFEQVREALTEGGVFSLWLNRFRIDLKTIRDVTATLLEVFPHARMFVMNQESVLFIATKKMDGLLPRLDERLRSTPELARFFERSEMPRGADVAARLELSGEGLRKFAEGGELIRDDKPTLELRLQAIKPGQGISDAELQEALAPLPFLGEEELALLDVADVLAIFESRIKRDWASKKALDRLTLTLERATLPGDARAYVEGMLAEARGDTATALAAYARSTRREAREAAAQLMATDGLWREALDAAREGFVGPVSREVALEAALRLGDEAALARALEGAPDEPFFSAARAYAHDGCAAFVDLGPPVEARSEGLLDLFVHCAATEPALAPRLGEAMELRSALRRGLAHGAYEAGKAARAGANLGAAERSFARTLALQPAHRWAAIQLMELLVDQKRTDEAQRVLDASLHHTQLLPEAEARHVRQAARRLGLRLPEGPSALEDAAAETDVEALTGAGGASPSAMN